MGFSSTSPLLLGYVILYHVWWCCTCDTCDAIKVAVDIPSCTQCSTSKTAPSIGENRKHIKALQTSEPTNQISSRWYQQPTCLNTQDMLLYTKGRVSKNIQKLNSKDVARHSHDLGRSTQVDLPVCLQPLTSEKHFTSKCRWRRWHALTTFISFSLHPIHHSYITTSYIIIFIPIFMLFTCSHVLTY